MQQRRTGSSLARSESWDSHDSQGWGFTETRKPNITPSPAYIMALWHFASATQNCSCPPEVLQPISQSLLSSAALWDAFEMKAVLKGYPTNLIWKIENTKGKRAPSGNRWPTRFFCKFGKQQQLSKEREPSEDRLRAVSLPHVLGTPGIFHVGTCALGLFPTLCTSCKSQVPRGKPSIRESYGVVQVV